MGLSRDLEKLSDYVQAKAVQLTPKDVLQSPYTFEFLGLKARDVLPENELETALLDNLQDFLLELGNGFCLEARQKRILIGDEYFFVDMVMYHRLLRCHVLIELKTDAFRHEYLGQLNSYLGYYRKGNDGRREPAGGHSVSNEPEQDTGRVRHGRPRQPAVCAAVPDRTSQQRKSSGNSSSHSYNLLVHISIFP